MKAAAANSTHADKLIEQYDANIQQLIHATRKLLLAAFPGTSETADPKVRLFGYSYGPGYKGTVATLILSKAGVKIGIPYGSSLPDPTHLMAGAGKVHRHVAVRELAELKAPALKALLKESLRGWHARKGSL